MKGMVTMQKINKLLSVFICMVMIIAMTGCENKGKNHGDSIQDDQSSANAFEPVTILACSDFQNSGGNEAASQTASEIMKKIKADFPEIDAFMCCGDYGMDIGAYVGKEMTENGIKALSDTVRGIYSDDIHEVYIAGNHDLFEASGLADSGINDPENNDYGVFVINDDDYMWGSNIGWSESNAGSGLSSEQVIENTAAELKEYLDQKLESKYTRPIFVLSHLPLHYSMRTRLDGDGMYANHIFDVLNDAAAGGLNIVYLFGHDHSNGWDDYLGGSAIYLSKGSNILIAQSSKTLYNEEVLGFTYMNAGYIGYYENHNGGDDTLTMSVFKLYEDKIEISRYSKNGQHNLKSIGVHNTYKGENDDILTVDKKLVSGKDTVSLNKTMHPMSEYADSATGVSVAGRFDGISVSIADIEDFSGDGYSSYQAYDITADGFYGKSVIRIPVEEGSYDVFAAYLDNYKIIEHTEDNGTVVFETDKSNRFIVAKQEPSGQTIYRKVTESADRIGEGNYIIAYNGSWLVSSDIVTLSGATGDRMGLKLVGFDFSGDEIVLTEAGRYERFKWTFVERDGKMLIGAQKGYITFADDPNMAVTVILSGDGEPFAISGDSGKYTFSGTEFVLNYNSRGLINGYENQPAEFELYKLTEDLK